MSEKPSLTRYNIYVPANKTQPISPFKNLYYRLEALSMGQVLLLLFIIGVLFSFLGLSAGLLFINDTAELLQTEVAAPRVEKVALTNEPSEVVGDLVLSGLVEKVVGSAGTASHIILDEAGQTQAYLVADDAKLQLIEGTKVEIVGTRVNQVEGLPLVKVVEVVYR